MTSVASTMPAPQARTPLWVGIAALVVLVLAGVVAPRPVLHGWLIAFATVGFVPFGAFAWMTIHRLTGGRWGELSRPAFEIAVSMLPLAAIFWLPLWIGRRLIYPWPAHPNAVGKSVSALYLNGGVFALTSLAFLVGLSFLARLALRRKLGRLGAGLALLFYAVAMNFLPFAWLLSLDPVFTSSAFGAQVIVQQLIAGLAFVAVVRLSSEPASSWKDIGALMLATTLGELYLILMTFIVFWYGDLPKQAGWYLRRTEHGWIWLEAAGITIGAVGPLVALLFSRVRDKAGPLRIVGACLLAGSFAQALWLVAPTTEAWSVPAALLAGVAMVGLCWGLLRPLETFVRGIPRGH